MKIERMIVTCALLVVCMATVLTLDSISIYKSSQITLSNSAILSPSTVTSLTNQIFNVSGVYENKNKTQAIIVLDGDLSKVSYLADTYQVFVDGKSSTLYSGGIYAFGELNKLCLFVTNAKGFSVEQTQFVIRSTASTGEKSKIVNETYANQSPTYSEHDQMSFYVNLGATEAQEVSFLEDSGIDIEKMAESAFSNNDDKAIRDALINLQSDAVTARTTLAHVRQSLDGVNIQLPVLPDWAIDAETGDIVQIKTRDNTNSEYVKMSYIFNGLADFDWENCTRLDSYEQLANVSSEALTPDVGLANEENNDDEIWYYKDNSVVSTPTTSETSLMSQYKTALSSFKAAEYKYQQGVARLIQNQVTYVDGVQNYTSNVGADVITSIN